MRLEINPAKENQLLTELCALKELQRDEVDCLGPQWRATCSPSHAAPCFIVRSSCLSCIVPFDSLARYPGISQVTQGANCFIRSSSPITWLLPDWHFPFPDPGGFWSECPLFPHSATCGVPSSFFYLTRFFEAQSHTLHLFMSYKQANAAKIDR